MNVLIATASNKGRSKAPIHIHLVSSRGRSAWLKRLTAKERAWVDGQDFQASAGQRVWLSNTAGRPDRVAVGWDGNDNFNTLGNLPFGLPEGEYRLASKVTDLQLLGWVAGAYQFTRYKDAQREPARLIIADNTRRKRLEQLARGIYLTRNLINTPASDMLPSQLEDAARALALEHEAQINVTVGDALGTAGYRTIYTVGQASVDAPRLIDLRWGQKKHPKIVLVGKGVCFDSGGLNIKPAGGMRNMKKDMGGAANVLGLAQLIMANKLPVNLRVLVPAVENAIAGNAYRPGDIIKTYQGLTVEIDNTDAEGRLVLCDALTLACEEKPQLIIDFATLTGSARSAVGTELSAMFCNDDIIANDVYQAGTRVDDPVWRMPLHADYNFMLNSNVADFVNSAASPFAGAITAALFLQNFVGKTPWLHFDIMAFNNRARPGRPEGGEAMGIRAVYDYLAKRFD